MSNTTLAQAESAQYAQQAYQHAVQQTLQLAVSHHEAGRMSEAEVLYRGILVGEPEQPQANHNLGVLLFQQQQPGEGLPHLEAALTAKPESERYWLSYLDALALVGQTDLALQMLTFGREHGLEGSAVDALAAELMAAEPLATATG